MQYLFDSRGRHVANEVNGHLHSPAGKNVGHFEAAAGVFIDLDGRYLGEVVREPADGKSQVAAPGGRILRLWRLRQRRELWQPRD